MTRLLYECRSLIPLETEGLYKADIQPLIFTNINIGQHGYIGYTNSNKKHFPYKTDFIRQVNEQLKAIKQKGEIQKIIDK